MAISDLQCIAIRELLRMLVTSPDLVKTSHNASIKEVTPGLLWEYS